MRFTSTAFASTAAAILATSARICSAGPSHSRRMPAAVGSRIHPARRDASTDMSKTGPPNNEGEAHGKLKPPSGSELNSVAVGTGGEEIQTYWTKNADSEAAKSAFIMIHGKLRDGDSYWTTMDNVLQSATKANYDGVDSNAIVVAPQFFSTKLNSGQYTDQQLAWDDVNAWQAGDPANHPSKTKLTSFDALDALVDGFADTTKYPNLKNITVVGHGGGGQLLQRYASVGKSAPDNVHVRYIHGDPSSGAYFTKDRPVTDLSIANKTGCPSYNEWRYGFDGFVGTSDGLKTPKEYFQQYISRDVISIVGLQDTDPGGDQYCMALLQGGAKRRDRNLSWWRYINMLAGTTEDLTGFPGNFTSLPDWSSLSNRVIGTRLIVVENADHDAELVFSSDEGRASLFGTGNMPTGWRPDGWVAKPAFQSGGGSNSSSTQKGSSTGTTSQAEDQIGSSGSSGRVATTGLASLVALVAIAAVLS